MSNPTTAARFEIRAAATGEQGPHSTTGRQSVRGPSGMPKLIDVHWQQTWGTAGDHCSKKIDHHLCPTLRPAQALLPEAAKRFGHQDPDDGIGLINHPPTCYFNTPSHIDVIGDCTRRPQRTR